MTTKDSNEANEYSPEEERPLAGYAAAMGIYGGVIVVATAVAKARGVRLPKRIDPFDFVVTALATHKLARIISKDAITSPLRAPFVRYKEPAGAGELNEEVRAKGVGHAFGELLTCPFCLSVWVATGLVGGLAVWPRATRMVTATFGAVAVSDALQYGYDALKKTEQ